MNKLMKISTLCLIIFSIQNSFSQKKDENIGTEVVNVVKPYTPSISDAFKIKDNPIIDDSENSKKEIIKYDIFSFPVASTFAPAKGRAANVEQKQKASLYKNYASIGFGNYGTVNAGLFITENIGEAGYFGAKLSHQSSQGNIPNIVLNNKYSNSDFDLNYGEKLENYAWKTSIGYQHQMYSWYGLPENFGAIFGPDEIYLLQNKINPNHSFQDFYGQAKIDFKDSFVSEIAAKIDRFVDSNNSLENSFELQPIFKFNIGESILKTIVGIKYQSNFFEKFYGSDASLTATSNESTFLNFCINPNYTIENEMYNINIGAKVVLQNNTKMVVSGIDLGNSQKTFVYPNISASANLVDNILIAFASLDGNLTQNSYHDFVDQNPFLSPTLTILPTDKTYDFNIGIKGKLTNNVGYTLKATLIDEKNKALFKNNPYNNFTTNRDYENGNSFGVVYDNIKTTSLFGELNADFADSFSMRINAEYNNYSTDNESFAWNLPNIKASSIFEWHFLEKWSAATHIFYAGARKDFKILAFEPAFIGGDINLDPYFDANFNLEYQYNEKLALYTKINNISGQNYQKWVNFPSQGLQFMVGAHYKFDF